MTLAEQRAPAPQDGSGPAAGYRFGETEDYRLGPQLGTPDLTIKKAQEGPFFYSMTGSYLLFVSNLGPGATTGQIVAYDLLPLTLTPVSATGTGWACSIIGQLVTCTHPGPLAAGASLPPIQVKVQVAAYSIPPARTVQNCARVSTPGDIDESNDQVCISTVLRLRVVISLVPGGTKLTWPHEPSFIGYRVWRNKTPYFRPNAEGADLLAELRPDPDATGMMSFTDTQPLPTGYYLIQSMSDEEQELDYSETGRFAFGLTPGQ